MVVASALRRQLQVDVEVVVAEVHVKGAGGLDGLLDAREGVDVGVGVCDVERDEQGADVVLAGEPADLALDDLRLQVKLEVAVQRLRRVGIGPVQADAFRADAGGRHGDGLHEDLLRLHVQHVRPDEREGERLHQGQGEFERRVLLLEVWLAGELDGVGDVVAVWKARVVESRDGGRLEQ